MVGGCLTVLIFTIGTWAGLIYGTKRLIGALL